MYKTVSTYSHAILFGRKLHYYYIHLTAFSPG